MTLGLGPKGVARASESTSEATQSAAAASVHEALAPPVTVTGAAGDEALARGCGG